MISVIAWCLSLSMARRFIKTLVNVLGQRSSFQTFPASFSNEFNFLGTRHLEVAVNILIGYIMVYRHIGFIVVSILQGLSLDDFYI